MLHISGWNYIAATRRAGCISRIVELLSSPSSDIQAHAISILSSFFNHFDITRELMVHQAVGPIKALLSSPSTKVRENASFVLQEIYRRGFAVGVGGAPPEPCGELDKGATISGDGSIVEVPSAVLDLRDPLEPRIF